MAAPKTDFNPFARRTYLQRTKDAVRYLLRLPGQAWRGYRNWPKQLRLLVTCLGVVALLGGAGVAGRHFYRKYNLEELRKEKVALEEAMLKLEPRETISAHIDRVLAVSPDEPQTLERRKALETGQANPEDVRFVFYNLRLLQQEYLKKDATEEARARAFAGLVREGQRRLNHEPRDYFCHHLLARLYLEKISRNDPAKEQYQTDVIRHLDALASPDANRVHLNFALMADALQLLKQLGRDVSRPRAFLVDAVMPLVKSEGARNEEPEIQAQMLFLFAETLQLPKLPPDVGLAWPWVSGLCQKCREAASAKGDIATLKNLAMLSPTFADGLAQMQSLNQINEAQRKEYGAALEGWTRQAWRQVIEKEPKNADAYFGLILSYARTQEIRECELALHAGMENCGDNPQLLNIFSNLTVLNDQEMRGYQRLKIAAERNPGMPYYWLLAAKVADRGLRRDLAFEALAKAREQSALMSDAAGRQSINTEISVMLADMYSGSGNPHKVLESLSGYTDLELVDKPFACRIFTRALAEIGDSERLDAFLDEAAKFSRKVNSPQPAYFAAQGLMDALPPSYERCAQAADYLEPICQRWRIEFPRLWQLRGACLFKNAVLRPGPLDPVLARQALNVLESALSLNGDHVPTAAALLYLRCRGEKSPAKALSEIRPLVAHINDLTGEQAEVLAMVYNENKQYDNALVVLKPFASNLATAGCWIQAALAYHGQGRPNEAEAALRNASVLPMSPREIADYSAARDLLSRVKQ